MRILHVVRGLANSSGTTHIVGPLAETQARQGHTVQVFYVEKPGQSAVTPDPSLVESRGFSMTVPTEHAGWSRPFARAVAGAVGQVDAVHVHAIWNFPTWWSMRQAHKAGVPYAVAPQGSLESWALGRSRYLKAVYAALAEKPYFDRAASVQALTEAEARQCRQFGIRAPIEILPNGVDLDAIDRVMGEADLRSELGLPSSAVLMLFLGRLFPKKGLDLLVPAFARLAADHQEAHLLIAGDDAGSGYRTTVERLVDRWRMHQRIRFLGEAQGDRKFQVMRGADAFVLPSYSEGLPVAVLEAMACRLPVVVTRHCNLDDVRTAEAGWVAEATVESVLDGLRAAAASAVERRRRGAAGRALVAERYTWDRIARNSLRLYGPHRVTETP